MHQRSSKNISLSLSLSLSCSSCLKYIRQFSGEKTLANLQLSSSSLEPASDHRVPTLRQLSPETLGAQREIERERERERGEEKKRNENLCIQSVAVPQQTLDLEVPILSSGLVTVRRWATVDLIWNEWLQHTDPAFSSPEKWWVSTATKIKQNRWEAELS